MASKVYHMDARSRSARTGLFSKMLICFDAARLGELIRPNDTVAIEVYCGEWNNTAYLRPVRKWSALSLG